VKFVLLVPSALGCVHVEPALAVRVSRRTRKKEIGEQYFNQFREVAGMHETRNDRKKREGMI